jgi:hypothetical protein
MKLGALSASAAALTLAFTTPSHALDEGNKAFVMLSTAAWAVSAKCDTQYEIPENSVRHFADRNGADFEKYGPAVYAGVMAQFDSSEFDRSALIPEVTVQVREVLMTMSKDFSISNAKGCAVWGKAVLPSGIIRRK